MTWSADRIAGYLALHRPEKWRLLVDDSPSWLARHPGGFGSVDSASIGENIRFNPTVLAGLLGDLPDPMVLMILDAILTWWEWSMGEFVIHRTPEQDLPRLFAQDEPQAFITFCFLVSLADVTPEDMLVY